ncbi:MAG: hypothetical protein JXL82_05295 [Candidatus Omnitrophica bacterium]|nr:hypothetical protein [Candidatus Omnitrophota bacterium]
MEKLGDTIISIIRELTAQKTTDKKLAPEEWLKKILTKRELGHIKFHYFRKGIVGLRVDSAVWKYNFNLKKERLLNGLKKCDPAVEELRFSIGDI